MYNHISHYVYWHIYVGDDESNFNGGEWMKTK